MNIETEILFFVRDSMYRIGELGAQAVKEMNSSGNKKIFNDKLRLIGDLLHFNQTLFSNYEISDPQYANAPNYFNDEDERETLKRLHFYRDYAGLNEVGYLEFLNYQPIIQYNKPAGGNLPQGAFGQVLGWNTNNQLSAISIDGVGGSTFNINDL